MNSPVVFRIAAVIFFILAAVRVPARVDWTNLGFACVTISFI
jgi:hypothetical protein